MIALGSIDGNAPVTPLFDTVSPWGLAIDPDNDTVYWTEFDGGSNSTNGRVMVGEITQDLCLTDADCEDGLVSTRDKCTGLGVCTTARALYTKPFEGLRGIALGSGSAPTSPTITIAGNCPEFGPNGSAVLVSLVGFTPNGDFALSTAAGPGSLSVGSGSCFGTATGLGSANLVRRIYDNVDSNGSASFEFNVRNPANCPSGVAQAIDFTSCEVSNVLPLSAP